MDKKSILLGVMIGAAVLIVAGMIYNKRSNIKPATTSPVPPVTPAVSATPAA